MASQAQSIDRSQFNSTVEVIMLVIPVAKTNIFMSRLKPYTLNRPRIRSVITPDICPSIFNQFDDKMRGILLNEEISKVGINNDNDLLIGLPSEEREWISSEGGVTPVKCEVQYGYELLTVEQVLRQVLPSNIPEIPSSFETAGHIAHLNLREEVLPYKYIVAQVILDKNTRIKTVVNKTASIATEFRTFPLEVLAGKDDLLVELKEGGANFKFDFRSVYWNSRLQFEHTRLSDLISSNTSSTSTSMDETSVGSKRNINNQQGASDDIQLKKHMIDSNTLNKSVVKSSTTSSSNSSNTNSSNKKKTSSSSWNGVIVADLMGGVGPFAVPLAQRGCIVHANDLNPESYKWLKYNTQTLNKGIEKKVYCNNADAREFVSRLRGRNFISNDNDDNKEKRVGIFAPESDPGSDSNEKEDKDRNVVWFHHAIMNLPQTAIEFLDAFQGYLYTGKDNKFNKIQDFKNNENNDGCFFLPMIHVYCFEKETDGTSESAAINAIQRCSHVLDWKLHRNDVKVHVVRYVSPQKPMLCLSFKLPLEVASRPPKY